MRTNFFPAIVVLVPGVVLGQADSAGPAMGYVPRSSVVKIGGSSGLASTLALSYERLLNDEIGVSLTASYMFPLRPEGILNLETEEIVIGGDRKLSGWWLTPEVKWYLEGTDPRPAPRGFYMGAYLRFSDMWYESDISGVANGSDVSAEFTSHMRVDLFEIGFGIDAGYQLLMFKDRIAVDFVFFGPRYSFYTLKVDADLQGDGELSDDLEQALENFLGHDLAPVDVELESSGTTTTGSNGLGYRLGVKFGYAF
jgi:hypothetical protein